MSAPLYAPRPNRVLKPRARRRGISAGKATAWSAVAVLLGASWGIFSIAALRDDRYDLLLITDTWWAWGVFLFVLALFPGGAVAKFIYVLIGGAVSITAYYVLKAWWAVGYPSKSRGFGSYFQSESYAYFMGIVALAAPVLALAVALVARVFRIARVSKNGPDAIGSPALGRRPTSGAQAPNWQVDLRDESASRTPGQPHSYGGSVHDPWRDPQPPTRAQTIGAPTLERLRK